MILALTNEAGQHVSLWQDYLSTQFDPAHLLSELGFTIIFELVELILIAFLWRRIIKPRLHAEVDEDHGIIHHEDHIHLNQSRIVMTHPRPKSRKPLSTDRR